MAIHNTPLMVTSRLMRMSPHCRLSENRTKRTMGWILISCQAFLDAPGSTRLHFSVTLPSWAIHLQFRDSPSMLTAKPKPFLESEPNASFWDLLMFLLFSRSVLSDSLQPHEPQHARSPCPSPAPGVHQTHVHWVGDAIQPSHPLSSPSPPALSLPQHQGLFKWVSSLHKVTKVLEFQLQLQSFQWIFRTDLL